MSINRVASFIFVAVVAFSLSAVLADDKTKGPKIKLTEMSYDFGTAVQGSQVKHIFKFKNVGTDTLKIAQVKTSCGCTAAESSKIIPPQKDGQIEVTYNTGTQLGKVSKTVYIYSNDVEAPQRSVLLQGIVATKKSDEKKK